MDLHLEGKVALVTGSSKGIGLAVAKALAREGASIVLNGRNGPDLASALQALSGITANAHAAGGDVCDPVAAASLVERCVSRHGAIDILINNVGGVGGPARLSDTTDTDWSSVLSRNVVQAARIIRLSAP